MRKRIDMIAFKGTTTVGEVSREGSHIAFTENGRQELDSEKDRFW